MHVDMERVRVWLSLTAMILFYTRLFAFVSVNFEKQLFLTFILLYLWFYSDVLQLQLCEV